MLHWYMMKSNLVYQGESEFNAYQIIDGMYVGRPARVLYSGGRTPQSGVALDDDPELLFDYNQRLLEIAQSMQPQSILVIGGGALTLPTALRRQLPHCQIDVVEIDPLLPDLAATYFDATPDDLTRVFVSDGVAYIADCVDTYDLIIVDAFSGEDIAQILFTPQVIADYIRCLQPGGMIAVNLISKYYTRRQSLTHTLRASFADQCQAVDLYPADHYESKHSEQNLLLVASVVELPALDYLHSVPVQLPVVQIK